MAEKRICMKKSRSVVFVLLVLVLFSFIAGCAGVTRINEFFDNNEYQQHGKIIDFGLFFIMFFALTYIGLTKVWGEGYGKAGAHAKGPIVGLCFALSLSLTFAIVTQTRFSITTIFPLAKALFFIIIWFLLWGLLDKTKMLGEGWGAKVAYAIMAGLMTYLLLSIATHMMCQMSENMDDPACQSDFFNWIFTVTDEWFDWGGSGSWWGGSSGGSSGGGGSNGGGGGDGGDITPKPGSTPTGPIRGGCRLDITFQYDSTTPVAGADQLQAYVNAVKQMGAKDVYIYGFASQEGTTTHNVPLSRNRADSIKNNIKMIDPSISVHSSGEGEATQFGGTLEENRRAVLSTKSFSAFAPGPGPGTLYNCTPTNVCGNNKKEGSEKCDGTDSSACPGKCQKDCTCEGDESSMPWWVWFLIPLIILLLLLFLVRRRSKVKIEDAITMKDHFLQEMDRIASQKELAWHSIIAVDPTRMTGDDVESKAQQMIDALEQELKEKSWHPIKKLAENYAKDLDQITRESMRFEINEQHIKLIVKALKELHSKYSPHDRWFAKKWDAVMFYSRLREVMTSLVSNNKIAKELHDFLVLQMKLKDRTEHFLKNEMKILVKYRQVEYSTMFGKKFWGTRHIVRRRGFPWLTSKGEVEGPIQEDEVTPSTTYGMVEVTQQVVDLARELITKIQGVIDEEHSVTHNAGSRVEFNNKYDIEKEVIKRLRHAILVQKRVMSEEWWPVIDEIHQPNQLKGHVHYRRY